MINQQIVDYINQQTQKGKDKEEITSALLAAGWQVGDVDAAFTTIASGAPMPMATELPKARQILKESWAIYKNRFKTLITIILMPTAAYLLLILLAATVTGITVGVAKQTSANIHPWIVSGIILGVVAVICLIYFYIWAAVAQLYAIKDQAENIDWKEAYKRSKPKIGAYFTTSLLAGLATVGGAILFIIPGIIFGLWFSQSCYVVVEEGLTNTTALKRSKYYTKGRIWQIFGKLFYVGVITMALYIALAILLAIFGYATGIKYAHISWITNIFSLVWTPLVTVYGYQIYKYCRATRP
jgi:hypothetical protein